MVQNQLLRAVIENIASPSNSYGVAGQLAYDTDLNAFVYHDGTEWITIKPQIQADWNQTNNTSLDFIKNKPTIPTLPSAYNGWMRKSIITDSATFNTGVAIYTFSWTTVSYSVNWDTNINRTTSDRLTNEIASTQLLRDNCCIEIATSDLDKSNITQCYAELHWARYDNNDTLIEELILDKAWVMMLDLGGTTGEIWGTENLFLQGDIEYPLSEDYYSKMWVEIYYDGPTANASLINGMQEHHHFRKT